MFDIHTWYNNQCKIRLRRKGTRYVTEVLNDGEPDWVPASTPLRVIDEWETDKHHHYLLVELNDGEVVVFDTSDHGYAPGTPPTTNSHVGANRFNKQVFYRLKEVATKFEQLSTLVRWMIEELHDNDLSKGDMDGFALERKICDLIGMEWEMREEWLRECSMSDIEDLENSIGEKHPEWYLLAWDYDSEVYKDEYE